MTLVGTLTAVLFSVAPAQTASQKPAPPPNTVTLQGCVTASPNARNMFTLDEEGQTYVLKGMNVRDFVGKHVEVIGVTVKRPRIVGGLYPSPNIAAQPDDPTKAAMATHSGPMSQSARPSIDFNVKSVRALTEPCPTDAR
jgi:hypothetical protein